jgi:hypothetical protein
MLRSTGAACQGASARFRLSPASSAYPQSHAPVPRAFVCPRHPHQPQQYDHQVLVLRLGEQLPKAFGKVAYMFIQTYNGNWHRTPPWFQGWIFFPLIPQGVLSCYFPFQKCKHRVYQMLKMEN